MDILDSRLIDDWKKWSDDMSQKMLGSKALRIANKCRMRGKTALAFRIDAKYKGLYPRTCDLSIAMSMALALRHRNK